jgi:predicted MFS family arabinose efflux permease
MMASETLKQTIKMIRLEEDKGIPRSVMIMMSAMAGLTVANLYYNQPLLELISQELGITYMKANLITVVTQVGYALGLLFIIPSGDLYSRRRIIMVSMLTAAAMAVVISVAGNVELIWGASVIMGACSVIPQLFIPIAGQFSRKENKSRNMGYVLSGLLTGILASRVISGFVGNWLGWRYMFVVAAVLMVVCCILTLMMMPDMKSNFSGSYGKLMRSVAHIYMTHPRIRLNSLRAAFGFGSMLSIWSCLAFHIAQAPFSAGSDVVGMLGACGIAGALAASGMGKYVPRFGVRRFSAVGAILQLVAWGIAWAAGDSYAGLIAAIIIVDIGLQCQQLSNQSCCIEEVPEASNRANTIFMTCYFVGGSMGTFCAGAGWNIAEWRGVCVVGLIFALASLLITALEKRILSIRIGKY